MAASLFISGTAHCLVNKESGRITALDAQLAEWLGIDPGRCDECHLSDVAPELRRVEWSTVPHGGLSVQANLVSKDRSEITVQIMLNPLIGLQHDCLLLTFEPAGAVPDVVYRDALTGLPDRRELALHRARWQRNRSGESTPHALLFMDLDEFKKVNDAYGHAVGDKVLASLAPRWQKCVRTDDLIVRYGGDEFVVLLAGIGHQKEVQSIVNRLVAATAEPITVDDLHVSVTVSIGVAFAEEVSVDLEQSLKQADRDMYAAKQRS